MTLRWGIVLALVLVIGVVGGWLVSASAAVQTNPAALAVGAVDPGWSPVGVIYLDESGALQFILQTVIPTIPPSPTAIPTNTPRPSATPTITRTASATPTATNTTTYTPTATQTPPAPTSAAPTQELTPQPTIDATETAPDLLCWGTAIYALNVRKSAGVSAGVVGGLAAGQSFWITESALVNDDEWARIVDPVSGITGWAASYFQGVEFITWENSENCMFIRWGDGTAAALLVGPHLLLNANVGALAGYLSRAGVVKEVSGNGAILAAARAVNPAVVTVYRTTAFGECPPDDYTGAQWIDLLISVWPSGASWYEPMNECAEFAPGYTNSFNLDMIRRANERGVCLLLYSFGVGGPSESFFAQTAPVWDYVLSHPCQAGRHHALGLHAYGLGYERSNTWLFSRWRRTCAALPGYCQRIGLWFTEWEHYDKESDPVDCARVRGNVRWALADYKGGPVRGIMLWSFGGWGWRDLTSCAAVL